MSKHASEECMHGPIKCDFAAARGHVDEPRVADPARAEVGSQSANAMMLSLRLLYSLVYLFFLPSILAQKWYAPFHRLPFASHDSSYPNNISGVANCTRRTKYMIPLVASSLCLCLSRRLTWL